jgi:hypothetical protein
MSEPTPLHVARTAPAIRPDPPRLKPVVARARVGSWRDRGCPVLSAGTTVPRASRMLTTYARCSSTSASGPCRTTRWMPRASAGSRCCRSGAWRRISKPCRPAPGRAADGRPSSASSRAFESARVEDAVRARSRSAREDEQDRPRAPDPDRPPGGHATGARRCLSRRRASWRRWISSAAGSGARAGPPGGLCWARSLASS